jgi:hypothetical protein
MSEPIPLYALPPSEYVVIDIETGNAPEAAIRRAMEAWEPPANIRDEAKIDARRAEAEARIREKSALLDAAPILCAAAKTQAQAVLFNGMDATDHQLDGVLLFSCRDERNMLLALRTWLDTLSTADTILVGHNLFGFDLPRLRGRFAWYKLRLPECLQPRMSDIERQPASDTMKLYQSFSIEHRDGYASVEEMATGLGIPHHKGIANGSMIPAMHAAGEYRTILSYCVLDCLTTEACWLRMTSEAPDLE